MIKFKVGELIFLGICLIFVGFIVGISMEGKRSIYSVQKQAIKEDVAYYNSTTAKFEWRNETIGRIFKNVGGD